MKTIDALMDAVLREAANIENNAALGGEHSDGGASGLRDQVRFYRYGQGGLIPPEWKAYEARLDPEWQEYLRLKQKFDGR